MGGLVERRENELVFADSIKSECAVSSMVDAQHRSSKFLSSIPPRSNPFSSPPNPFSYPSSAPLLPQLRSILQGLEDLSLQGSPQAVSTPFAAPTRPRADTSHPTGDADANLTPPPIRKLSSGELPEFKASAATYHPDQDRPELGLRAKGELQISRLLPVAAKHRMIDRDLSKHILVFPRTSTFLLETKNSILASEARNCK